MMTKIAVILIPALFITYTYSISVFSIAFINGTHHCQYHCDSKDVKNLTRCNNKCSELKPGDNSTVLCYTCIDGNCTRSCLLNNETGTFSTFFDDNWVKQMEEQIDEEMTEMNNIFDGGFFDGFPSFNFW